ncbi:hypothetical protein Tco_0447847 [Tanacetum coccineum]
MPSIPSPEPAISCFDDLDFFKEFENEFPAIVYNDAQTSNAYLLTEPILIPQHIDVFNLNNETSVSEYDEEEQDILYFNDIFPSNIIRLDDLNSKKDNNDNDIDIIQSSEDMDLPPREQRHRFLRYEGLEYFDADIADFEARLARIYRRDVHRVQVESARQILDKGDLRDYWIGISSARYFLGTALSYTMIRDPILRLCHRLIAYSIAGRSQAPEKVTMIDLYHLRGIDVDSVNVPYLLARYLRLFAAGRKSGAHISGGQFVARLAEHFGLLTAEILGGLTAWVAMGPERQPDVADGAPAVAKDAPAVDEGDQAVLAPIQAPQQPPPPPAAARTVPHRLGRLEEDMQGLRRDDFLRELTYNIPETNQTKDWKRRTFWSLNEDILKITILKTNTPYPSKKIEDYISAVQFAVSSLEDYGVSVPALTMYRIDGVTKHFTTLREILHMGDLKVLLDSMEGGAGYSIWGSQQNWQVRSWRLYTFSNVHVLETMAGIVLYMFVDVPYALSVKLMEMMLKHKLELARDVVGNDLTTAEQLIGFIKNQLAAAQVPAA